MKRLLPAVLLCLALVGCGEQKYIDMSAQTASPTPTPGLAATPAPAKTSSATPSLAGALSDADVEAIMGRAGQITLDGNDVPQLEQIMQDLQPILEAFESVSKTMTAANFEDEDWVKQAGENAADLEAACDTAIKQSYGENLNDLQQLLNAGYDAFKKGASSLRQAVAKKDTGMISTATGWLMLGIDYEAKATEYLRALSAAAAESPQPSESPKPSGTD